MNRYKYLLFLPLLLSACRDDSMRLDIPLEDNGMEVRLQAEIDQLNLTRADDSGFADGDVIGVFAVDFVNGQPGQLSPTGNNADNVAFTFDENSYRWNGASSILFSDDKTPMDIFGYYPYSKNVEDVEAYPISVEYNQNVDSKSRKMSAYEASDFLWAKSAGLTSANPLTTLYFKHVLASVRVSLLEGEGFAEGEWNDLEKSVLVCNTSRDATINLSTGEVNASSQKDGRSIVAKRDRGDYRAIVIPQIVEANTTILNITVGAKSYEFKRSEKMIFNPTKQHNFTVQVNKNTSNGDLEFMLLDESITPWESDLNSHNGKAKEYMVMEIPEAGTLSSVIKQNNIDASSIVNLKLIGSMNEKDFEYIRNNMSSLEAINLHDVDLSNCQAYDYEKHEDIFYVLPYKAFYDMPSLSNFVFPAKIRGIRDLAFYGTSLSGSLEIPEGVTFIGDKAFDNNKLADFEESILGCNNLTGELRLPSTLKKIGRRAFSCCDFTGILVLPDGLEEIGSEAFSGCKFMKGSLHIPESVKKIEFGAFSDMKGLTGWIILPSKMKEVNGLSGLDVVGVEWPENASHIGFECFANFNCKGTLVIPNSITSFDYNVFRDARIKHIVLPSELIRIPSDCFSDCIELQDTLTIPSKVESIEEKAFVNCFKIEALVLPASLRRIDDWAFSCCFNLNYIRCDAVEPPVISESTFAGIEKDNFTVEVPERSVDAYRNAPGWSEFKRIAAYKNFVARPSKFNVLNKGGKKEIVLNADGDWEMMDCPSWCHIDKMSGSKKSTLILNVEAMAKGSPVRNGKITFRLKGNEEYLTHIDVGQYDYEYDEDEYLTLQSASKGKGINLVFLGDGYDAADISSGVYLSDMRQEMDYFFGVEPYSTYRDYFNVYTAFALSEDSGVESLNSWRKTKFHVCLGDGSNQRLTADWEAALDYCASKVLPTVMNDESQVGCIIVANTDVYEGVTYMGDSFCSVVTKSNEYYPYDARGLVQHEAGGHGIGWLGDEYMYHAGRIQNCGCICCKHVDDLKIDHSMGYSFNLSLTGKYEEVPWSHLIFNPSYGDIADVYEGGYFHKRGVYRSEINSCMNNNVPYFSTWSRQLIVQRIMKLAGEQFDLNSFYAKDSRAVGRDFTSTSRSWASKTPDVSVRHGNAPIMIKGYKYGKKGGRK